MSVSVVINDLGRPMWRGDAAVVGRSLVLCRPDDEVETVTIDFSQWLGSASYADRLVETQGVTVTDQGVANNVWTVQVTDEGEASLMLTASDGRRLKMHIVMSDPFRAWEGEGYH